MTLTNTGASAKVTFDLPTDMLNFTGRNGRQIVEPGALEMMVGTSSDDIRLTTIVSVVGAMRELPQNWRMESDAKIALL